MKILSFRINGRFPLQWWPLQAAKSVGNENTHRLVSRGFSEQQMPRAPAESGVVYESHSVVAHLEI